MTQLWDNQLSAKKNFDKINLPFKGTLVFSLLTNLLIILGVVSIQSFLPPQVPLFYGLAESEEQLASRWFLTLPSGLSLLIVAVNSLVALRVKDLFLKRSLILSGVLSTLLTSITTFKIIFLIGSF